MKYTLILGNQAYSSWSLRGWLLLRASGIEFDLEVVPLRTGAFDRFVAGNHPARTVPTLVASDGERTQPIWDSLAIAEFLHEHHPRAGLWPESAAARAAARCLAAEMHSSFGALRSELPMNVHREYRNFNPGTAAQADIDRVLTLWNWARERWGGGGPYLFGARFCAADAFYAPVVSRFRTYGVALDDAARRYVDALLEHPATVEFIEAGKAETWIMPENEFDDLNYSIQPREATMKYAVMFEDNDDFAHKRQEFMADHLRFLQDNADRIESAGPLKNARSGDPAGGIWIVEADDVAVVEALIEADPFWPTGLRKSVRVLAWTQVFADGKKLI